MPKSVSLRRGGYSFATDHGSRTTPRGWLNHSLPLRRSPRSHRSALADAGRGLGSEGKKPAPALHRLKDLPGSGRIGLCEVPPSFVDPVRLEPFSHAWQTAADADPVAAGPVVAVPAAIDPAERPNRNSKTRRPAPARGRVSSKGGCRSAVPDARRVPVERAASLARICDAQWDVLLVISSVSWASRQQGGSMG